MPVGGAAIFTALFREPAPPFDSPPPPLSSPAAPVVPPSTLSEGLTASRPAQASYEDRGCPAPPQCDSRPPQSSSLFRPKHDERGVSTKKIGTIGLLTAAAWVGVENQVSSLRAHMWLKLAVGNGAGNHGAGLREGSTIRRPWVLRRRGFGVFGRIWLTARRSWRLGRAADMKFCGQNRDVIGSIVLCDELEVEADGSASASGRRRAKSSLSAASPLP
ncbi:hypothetical protein GALMADRAFT_212065 [Galerina marginata CBS 339.88]|uniref:Uncharacterized protein n=1 Tax=Galerina marginata (strain CBS 339.88) TaxID=685588 RepID=A0A067SUE4_GALM3|nr:hypothetical protein GALMADRAFT_212065 [Galerina marginata CBS 339.88]